MCNHILWFIQTSRDQLETNGGQIPHYYVCELPNASPFLRPTYHMGKETHGITYNSRSCLNTIKRFRDMKLLYIKYFSTYAIETNRYKMKIYSYTFIYLQYQKDPWSKFNFCFRYDWFMLYNFFISQRT